MAISEGNLEVYLVKRSSTVCQGIGAPRMSQTLEDFITAKSRNYWLDFLAPFKVQSGLVYRDLRLAMPRIKRTHLQSYYISESDPH